MHPLNALWNLRRWICPNRVSKNTRRADRKSVALETLESREVPATILVTNLEDGTNPTSPIPGSLRWALMTQQSDPLTSQGTTIEFDESLFKDEYGNWMERTLTLNGAAGALVPNQLLVTVDGTPDAYDTYLASFGKQDEWKPLLTIQADIGLRTVTVLPGDGGSGYQLGDIIEQGTGTFSYLSAGTPQSIDNCGGARFQVTGLDPLRPGAIASLAVLNPGSNAFLGKVQTSGTSNVILNYTNTDQPTRLKTISGSGSGLTLKQFNTGNISYASSLFYTQLIETQSANANQQSLTLEDIRFGDSKGSNILQNLGLVSVKECIFDGNLYNPTLTKDSSDIKTLNISPEPFITSSVGSSFKGEPTGAGGLSIYQSDFRGNSTQINYKGQGPLIVSTSRFYKDLTVLDGSGVIVTNPLLAKGRAIEALMDQLIRSSTSISNSQFFLNEWSKNPDKHANIGVYTNSRTFSGVNNIFTNNSGGALVIDQSETLNSTATINSCVFQNNLGVETSTFPTNYRNGGSKNSFGGNAVGSGALFTFGAQGTVTVSGSIFENNKIPSIPTLSLSSGGAAIYSRETTLNIIQSSFTGNEVTLNATGPGNAGGGAIYSGGQTAIYDSLFTKNKFTSTVDMFDTTSERLKFTGGGAIYLAGSTVNHRLSNTTIQGNSVVFAQPTGSTATGAGLTGGAIILANSTQDTDEVDQPVGNIIVNCTITQNALVNTKAQDNRNLNSGQFLQSIYPDPSSRNQVINITDTGGIFNDTTGGNTFVINTILLQNTGLVYDINNSLIPTPAISNTGSRPLLNASGSNRGGDFSYGRWNNDGFSGYNLYNNAYSYYQPDFAKRYNYTNDWLSFGQVINPTDGSISNDRADGDLISGSFTNTTEGPVFDTRGLADNLAVTVGLQVPVNYPAQWGSYPAISAKLLTMGLDRNSPARDGGYSEVYENNPGPILNDARGVKRLMNEAVDIGAYEVQTGTDSSFNDLDFNLNGSPLPEANLPLASSGTATIFLPANLIIQPGQQLLLNPLQAGNIPDTTIGQRGTVTSYTTTTGQLTFTRTGFFKQKGTAPTSYSKWRVSLVDNPLQEIRSTSQTPATTVTFGNPTTFLAETQQNDIVDNKDPLTNIPTFMTGTVDLVGLNPGLDVSGTLVPNPVYGKGEISNLLGSFKQDGYVPGSSGALSVIGIFGTGNAGVESFIISPALARPLAIGSTISLTDNVTGSIQFGIITDFNPINGKYQFNKTSFFGSGTSSSSAWALNNAVGTFGTGNSGLETFLLVPSAQSPLSIGTTVSFTDASSGSIQYGIIRGFVPASGQYTFEKTNFFGLGTTSSSTWILNTLVGGTSSPLSVLGTFGSGFVGNGQFRIAPDLYVPLDIGTQVSFTDLATGTIQYGTISSYTPTTKTYIFNKTSFYGLGTTSSSVWSLNQNITGTFGSGAPSGSFKLNPQLTPELPVGLPISLRDAVSGTIVNGTVSSYSSATGFYSFNRISSTGPGTASSSNWILIPTVRGTFGSGTSGTASFQASPPLANPLAIGQTILLTDTITGTRQYGMVTGYNPATQTYIFDKTSFFGAIAPATTNSWVLSSIPSAGGTFSTGTLPSSGPTYSNGQYVQKNISIQINPKPSSLLTPGQVVAFTNSSTGTIQYGLVAAFNPTTSILTFTQTRYVGPPVSNSNFWTLTNISSGWAPSSTGIETLQLEGLPSTNYQPGDMVVLSPFEGGKLVSTTIQIGTVLSFDITSRLLQIEKTSFRTGTDQKFNEWQVVSYAQKAYVPKTFTTISTSSTSAWSGGLSGSQTVTLATPTAFLPGEVISLTPSSGSFIQYATVTANTGTSLTFNKTSYFPLGGTPPTDTNWTITSASKAWALSTSGIQKMQIQGNPEADYQAGWNLLLSPVRAGVIQDAVQYGTVLSYDPTTRILEFLKVAKQGGTVQTYDDWVITAIPNISQVTVNDPSNTLYPDLPSGTHPYKWVYNSDYQYAYSQSDNFYINATAVAMGVSLAGPGVPTPSNPGTSVQFQGTLSINSVTQAAPQGTLYLKGKDASGNTINLANQPIDASTPFDPTTKTFQFTFNYSFPRVAFPPGNYPVWVEFDSVDPNQFSDAQSGQVTQELGYNLNGLNLAPFINPVDPTKPFERTQLVTFTASARFNAADGVPNGQVVFRSQDGQYTVGTVTAPTSVTFAGTTGTATYTLVTSPVMVPAGVTAMVADYQRTATGTQYLSLISAPQNLDIVGEATTVNLSGGPTSSTFGTRIDMTAIVGPSGGLPYTITGTSPEGTPIAGKVLFYRDGSSTPFAEQGLTLNNFGWPNPVNLSVANLDASSSTIRITAVYTGDGKSYKRSSDSNLLSLTIAQATTNLGLSFVPAGTTLPTNYPIQMVAQLTQTAPAPAPAGTTVVFYDSTSGTPVQIGTGTVQADGSATLTTPYTLNNPGTYILSASFAGNVNYTPSSRSVVVTAYNRVQPQASLTLSPATPVTSYGVPLTMTVNLVPSGGTSYSGGQVIFRNGSTELGRVTPDANGLTTFTPSPDLQPGAYQFSAEYTGDTWNYMPATSTTINQTIDKGITRVTLSSTPATVQVGKTITLTAVVDTPGSSPDIQPSGVVDFYLAGKLVGSGTLSGGQATLANYKTTTVGTLQFEARYAGNSLFKTSTGTTNVVVSRDPIELFYLVAPQEGNSIQVFDRATNRQVSEFLPETASYAGGFTVAKGDVNGDGVYDMLYAPNQGGQITVLDGRNYNPLGVVNPFGTNFPTSLSISVGDINGDGYGDILAAPGGFGLPPHVVAMSGKDFTKPLFSRYAYAAQFLGGVSVAAGDTNGDGFQDVITAPLRGAPPHIVSFSGRTGEVLQSYYAYAPLYLGGVSITAKDLNNDGYAEIITAASASAPHVVIVDSKLAMETPRDSSRFVLFSQYVYAPNFGGGVRVTTVADLNGDGVGDILFVPGPGAGPNLVRINGALALENKLEVLDSFFAYGSNDPNASFLGGAFVG